MIGISRSFLQPRFSSFPLYGLRAAVSPLLYLGRSNGPYEYVQGLGCTYTSASPFSSETLKHTKSLEEYRKAVGLKTQEDYIRLDKAYCSPNYNPTPVVITKGEGVYVWDTDGNRYFDFVSGISSVNQGHCHPRITAVLREQGERLTLTSRNLYNDCHSVFCKYISDLFGYQRALLMNTGAEAGETAVKLARKWGYEVKGIKKDNAKIIFFKNNYWGRTIAAASSSSTLENYRHFGPYTPGFELIEYNNIEELEKAAEDVNVCGVFIEPIQGEGGVVVPDKGYIKNVENICRKKNILLIIDEIQTGLGRTGKMLACNYDDIRGDIVLLGKSLTGGLMPASCILTNTNIIKVFTHNTHGSTYGGNPLACAVSFAAINILIEENMIENSYKQGKYMRKELNKIKNKFNLSFIKDIRGKGLFNAIEINTNDTKCMHLCMQLKDAGVLCRPTKGNIIRLLPPLIINKTQIDEALQRMQHVFTQFQP